MCDKLEGSRAAGRGVYEGLDVLDNLVVTRCSKE